MIRLQFRRTPWHSAPKRQTAETCKRHLRQKYRDQGGLVKEFISEFEGVGKNSGPTRWGSFTDVKGIEKEMLERLDAFFKTWLSP
jgi:hypothetical protein